MNEQVDRSMERAPEKPRFQFGLKHLMALPVVVAVFFAIATYTSMAFAILILVTVLGTAGLFCSPTRRITIIAIIVLAIFGFLLALLMPREGRGPVPPRVICSHNLGRIALAMHNYHNAYGCFPPACITDEDGRPMHSWRVLLLPFLEQAPLHDLYDFDEPWDGPNNRKLAGDPLAIFNCPGENKYPSTATDYLVVVGPETMWPGSEPMNLDECTDGPGNTILVVEVANSDIHWMEPRDLHVRQMAPSINPPAGQGISSFHTGGANVAMVDGRVEFLPDTTTPEELRRMLSRSGGERIDMNHIISRAAD